MRWDALFDDLEGELEAAERRELDDEVAERTRIERAAVLLVDRARGSVGAPVELVLDGGGRISGVLTGCGPDWLRIARDGGGGEAVVALAALTGLTGLARGPAPAARVAAGLGLAAVLAALARTRQPLRLWLVDGSARAGVLVDVGRDAVDLAERGPGEPPARRTVTVPLTALAWVEPRG